MPFPDWLTSDFCKKITDQYQSIVTVFFPKIRFSEYILKIDFLEIPRMTREYDVMPRQVCCYYSEKTLSDS
jgi:hypothetical protein